MTVPKELLAKLGHYQEWRSGKLDFDMLDYVNCVATPDLLFGFLELLRPSLVLHQGNYFLASHFDEANYNEWMKRLNDPVAVQKVMNHLHISTLFQQQEVPDIVAREAAQQIAACWSKVLADRGLVAEAFGDTLEDAEVTFFGTPKWNPIEQPLP
jgi:hypothetical protein